MRFWAWIVVAGCGGDPCAPERLSAGPNVWGLQLAVDATDVYWSEVDPSEILRMPKSGGTSSVVASPATDFGGGMAVADGVVYWSGRELDTYALFATAADGTTTSLAPMSACDAYPGVALDGDIVFAATYACDGMPAELVAVPRAGGTVVRSLLASGALRFVVGDGAAQLVIGDELVSIPAAGGEVTRLAQIVDGEVLGRDASTIFVNRGNQLLEIPAAGGEPRPLGPELGQRPVLAVADASHVFVIAGGLFAIARDDSAEPQRLVENTGDAGALAIDDDAVYWTSSGPGDRVGLWRSAKCAAD